MRRLILPATFLPEYFLSSSQSNHDFEFYIRQYQLVFDCLVTEIILSGDHAARARSPLFYDLLLAFLR